jgi:hypothetical protein
MSRSNWDAIGSVVVASLVFYLALIVVLLRRGAARMPRGIAKRLRRAGDRVEVKIGGTASVWDPGRPLGPDNARWGPARATYTRDDTGIVHLHFQPALATAVDTSGPIPDFPTRPRFVRVLLAGYVVATVAGFTIGFAVGRGPLGERLLWGCGGLLGAMVLIWALSLVVNVGKAARDTARPRKPASW